MPKKPESLLPEQPCEEVSIDPEVETSRPDLVRARTASWILTQTAHRPWNEKYANRMACLEGGALAGAGAPFKVTWGEMAETKKLLSTIIASHPESCPVELQEEYKEMDSEQETNRSWKMGEKYSKSVLELGDPGRFKDAGYDAIKQLLRETTERLVAGRGGKPYMGQLEKIEKRKQAAIDARAKSGVQFPIVRELSNETLRKIYRKKGHTAAHSSKEEDGQTEEEEEEEEEEEIEERELTDPECSFETLHLGGKFFTERLTCILKLLCSLHNLRNRLLRTRRPLNGDAVVSLRRFPFDNLKKTDSSSGILLPDIQRLAPSAKDLPAAAAASQASGLEPSLSNLSFGSTVSSVASSRNLMTSSMASPGSSSRLRTGSPLPSATRRVEVWEDLLAVDPGETSGKSPPTKYRAPWQHTLTRDSLQLHLGRHEDNKRLKDVRSKFAIMTTDPSLLVPNFREFLAQTREKVRRKTLQELEKLESCRLQKFHLIFHSLNSPDEIPEKYFPKMRRLLDNTETEYTTDWFRRLVDEAESVQMRTNDVVSDLLKKLKQFVYNQPTDLPFYREKMCLLVLSTPADEICRPAWQSALIFVMVRILEWRLEVLKHWLSTRGLYILPYIEEAN